MFYYSIVIYNYFLHPSLCQIMFGYECFSLSYESFPLKLQSHKPKSHHKLSDFIT